MRIGQTSGSNVREIIRAAEKFIATGEYGVALDQLTAAKSMQPNNAYITAIIERIHALQKEKERAAKGDRLQTQGSSGALAVTIGDGTGNVFPMGDDARLSGREAAAQITRLTLMAHSLYERGSYESAFDSLMKAYLIDPVSPEVEACEQVLLPAWEMLRKRKSQPSAGTAQSRRPPDISSGNPTTEMKSESGRLDLLKRQRESERLERERAVWREASMPPKPVPDAREPVGDHQKSSGRILAKFRLGKFLG